MEFKRREIVSPKLTLKLEIELLESTLTAEEAAEKISFALEASKSKDFSAFIVFLLRETRSSMWELKGLSID